MLVIQIFLLVLFSIVEFSLVASARMCLNEAARHGARMVCITDKMEETVRHEIGAFLGPRLAYDALVEIEDSGKAGNVVNVRIRISMQNASPELLWMTGFSVRDRYLFAAAPMAREHDITRTPETYSERIVGLCDATLYDSTSEFPKSLPELGTQNLPKGTQENHRPRKLRRMSVPRLAGRFR